MSFHVTRLLSLIVFITNKQILFGESKTIILDKFQLSQMKEWRFYLTCDHKSTNKHTVMTTNRSSCRILIASVFIFSWHIGYNHITALLDSHPFHLSHLSHLSPYYMMEPLFSCRLFLLMAFLSVR